MKDPIRLKVRAACGCDACKADYASEYLCDRGERIVTVIREVLGEPDSWRIVCHDGMTFPAGRHGDEVHGSRLFAEGHAKDWDKRYCCGPHHVEPLHVPKLKEADASDTLSTA